MKRQYTDSYYCKAITGMISVLGSKKVTTQAPPSMKASRNKLLKKMIKYVARAGWKP
ncbi:hypothetical protein [Pseudomonas phage vB_PaeM_PAO1_Ab17]|uniref:Uncharacterized protein n=2 Tax=Nankokuvirus Ab03 TaxID=1925780 RepID=A0A0A1IV38_9CAUD|nr:hypothetical protein VC54_gp058 [Pseudomonas phage vB_PaeM_PAO1_Ab03]CEF89258.1 hypothetical protein [Pseudomonas phage vB_PaeM_PAO1_Ab03]CEF89636.1 hypothetical protein [Pseudomonas phage vB_PaeM_PAO1_Ab17]